MNSAAPASILGKLPNSWDLPHPVIVTSTITGKAQKRLGEIDSFSAEAKEAYKRGRYIVEDLVLPQGYEMKIEDCETVLTPERKAKLTAMNPRLPVDLVITEAWRLHWLTEAEKVNDALTEFGVGATFACPVGDGSAHYVVTAMKKTTCTVEWRGFCCDNWQDRVFGLGGSFRIKDVARLCRIGKPPLPMRTFPGDVGWKQLEEQGIVPTGMI